MTKVQNTIIDAAKEAYIAVMGAGKWNSLTDKEKHDAVMLIVKDANKALKEV